MAILTLKTTGEKRLQRKFTSLAKGMKNRKPLFKGIGVELINEIGRTFKSQTWEGTHWIDIKPATKASRRRGEGVGSPQILIDTSTLRNSFDVEATNNQVRVGSPLFLRKKDTGKVVENYGEIHEKGLGNVPQRRMIPSLKRGLEIAIEQARNFTRKNISKAKL